MATYKNCNVNIEKNHLVVRIDLAEEVGVSKSGKSLILGTTGGNQKVARLGDGREVTLGVNCYTSLGGES